MEQQLLSLRKHLSSPPVFGGVRVTRSLVLCVCVADRCLSYCVFSFGRCVVCSSSIYGFWLPLWYLQTLLWINKIPTLLFIELNVPRQDGERSYLIYVLGDLSLFLRFKTFPTVQQFYPISASQAVSRNSAGHVEGTQPIKCMFFILICQQSSFLPNL